MSQPIPKIKCPKCGSEKKEKRAFGKKSLVLSIIFLIYGLFWSIKEVMLFLFANRVIIVRDLILFVLGVASLSLGITGIFGKTKCKECGSFY